MGFLVVCYTFIIIVAIIFMTLHLIFNGTKVFRAALVHCWVECYSALTGFPDHPIDVEAISGASMYGGGYRKFGA